jgi:hypothetical protein
MSTIVWAHFRADPATNRDAPDPPQSLANAWGIHPKMKPVVPAVLCAPFG